LCCLDTEKVVMDQPNQMQYLPRFTVVLAQATAEATLGMGDSASALSSISAYVASPVTNQPVSVATQLPPATIDPRVRLIDPGSLRLPSIDIAPTVSQLDSVPRAQLAVPVSPTATVGDLTLFESPDGATRYVLPRYRIATQQVADPATGQTRQQFRMALASDANGGSLALSLEKYPAPEIGAAAQTVQELPHQLAVRLRYQIPGGGAQEELIAQERTAEPGGVRVVFRVDNAAKLAQMASAISEPAYAASLVVTRATTVAIPLAVVPDPPVISAGSGQLRGTWLFDLDSGAEATSGEIWWEQMTDTARQIVPQRGAQIANIGVTDFDSVTFGQLQSLAYGSAPIDGSIRQITRPRRVPPNRIRKPGWDRQDDPWNEDPWNGDDIVIDQPIGQIRNGDVFAVITDQGNYAKVQVQQYGYDLSIRWVTYLRPAWSPGTQLYGTTAPMFDTPLDPQPFTFPRDLYGYIYRAIGVDGHRYGLIRQTIRWNGQDYSYYQDEAQPQVFKYLPDSFKIARQSGQRRYPSVALSYVQNGGNLQDVQVKMDYKAAPHVEPARILDAAAQLKARLNPPLPMGVAGLQFEPLLPAPNTTRLRIKRPGADADLHTQAVIDLRQGINDLLAVPIDGFSSIYAALLSDVAAFFEGWVEVDVGGVTEHIPFIARLNDLEGSPLTYERGTGDWTQGVPVTLRNASESPLRANSLGAQLIWLGANEPASSVAAAVVPQGVALPIDLAPGATLPVLLTATSAPPGSGAPAIAFDTSGITVQPDPKSILRAITASVGASFTRTITVKAFAPQFAEPTNPVTELIVNFATGGSVDLTPDHLQGTLTIHFPYDDYILSQISQGTQTNAGIYNYSLTVVRQNGPEKPMQLGSSDELLVLNVPA
jgi:hypothetical protein